MPFRWAFTLAFLRPAPGLTQEGATLAGRALDDASGSPIGLATVTVSDPATGQTLSGTLPDEDGRSLLVVWRRASTRSIRLEQTHYIVGMGSDLLMDDSNTLTLSGIYPPKLQTPGQRLGRFTEKG